ncbi:MAG: hypothetical protein IPI11_06240 [Haliscomenobacter sp.]|nr:hypothetical protein [Haliscomenobacter sp.]
MDQVHNPVWFMGIRGSFLGFSRSGDRRIVPLGIWGFQRTELLPSDAAI